MPLIEQAHDSNIIIVRLCSGCGGTPQMLNHVGGCFRCNNTGRESFTLSDCWWIDKEHANSVQMAEFNRTHGLTDKYGGPRVDSQPG